MSKQGEIIREMLKAYVSIIGTVDERLEAVEILQEIIKQVKNELPPPIAETVEIERERKRRPKQRIDIELALKVYKTACKYPNYTLRQLDEKLHLYSGTIQYSKKTFLFMGKPLKLSHIVKIARVHPTLFVKRREVKI